MGSMGTDAGGILAEEESEEKSSVIRLRDGTEIEMFTGLMFLKIFQALNEERPGYFEDLYAYAKGEKFDLDADNPIERMLPSKDEENYDEYLHLVRCAVRETPEGLTLGNPFAEKDPHTKSQLADLIGETGNMLSLNDHFWDGGDTPNSSMVLEGMRQVFKQSRPDKMF